MLNVSQKPMQLIYTPHNYPSRELTARPAARDFFGAKQLFSARRGILPLQISITISLL
jgi:hypothetical protein